MFTKHIRYLCVQYFEEIFIGTVGKNLQKTNSLHIQYIISKLQYMGTCIRIFTIIISGVHRIFNGRGLKFLKLLVETNTYRYRLCRKFLNPYSVITGVCSRRLRFPKVEHIL